MDVLSHGLWGGVAFGRKSRKSYWIAFLAGVLPDILVFGPSFIQRIFAHGFDFSRPSDAASIPAYVHQGYNITHSLVVFAVVFGIVWLIRQKPLWELLAWPLHILVDLPTHSTEFFPTPYLWPFPHPFVDGRSWGTPEIFFPNVALLVLAYTFWYFQKKRGRVGSS